MVYIVLGMHKSGTTLISEMLHKSGINMVSQYDEDSGYDKGQKFERLSTKRLNKLLLRCGDLHSLKIPTDFTFNNTKSSLRDYAGRIICKNNEKFPQWGFKDPRTCLAYPFWQESLPKHKIIAIYRDPVQIAERYSTFKKPLQAFKALKRWKTYNGKIINILTETDLPFIVLNYESVMDNDEEIKRLSDFIGFPVKDTRKKDKYRNRSKNHFAVDIVNLFSNRSLQSTIKGIEKLRT